MVPSQLRPTASHHRKAVYAYELARPRIRPRHTPVDPPRSECDSLVIFFAESKWAMWGGIISCGLSVTCIERDSAACVPRHTRVHTHSLTHTQQPHLVQPAQNATGQSQHVFFDALHLAHYY